MKNSSFKSRLIGLLLTFSLNLTLVAAGLILPLLGGNDANGMTQGTVLSFKSGAATGKSFILYSYRTQPASTGAGEYRREQIVDATQAKSFKVGGRVPVEFSRFVSGASRIKGFGRGSVLLESRLQIFSDMLKSFVPVMILVRVVGLLKIKFDERKSVSGAQDAVSRLGNKGNSPVWRRYFFGCRFPLR